MKKPPRKMGKNIDLKRSRNPPTYANVFAESNLEILETRPRPEVGLC